jgi:hypothetical protein
MLPRSGDIVTLSKEASVQFAVPILFRVIRVHDWPTYDGWVWLDGYQLNHVGDAVERRSVFVQISGLHPPRPARPKSPRNTRAVPQQQRTGDVVGRRVAPLPRASVNR